MKSYILFRRIGITLFCGISFMSAVAQNANIAYFTSGFDHRYNLNPAFMPERNIINIPVLSNINVALNGNLGVDNFIYKYDDPTGKYGMTTFLHRTIDGKKFINDLPDNLKTNIAIDIPVLGFGFRAWGGYNIFDIGLHSTVGSSTSKGLFDFIKNGQSDTGMTTYDMSDTRVDAASYVNLSLGHSRVINDKLTVGVTAKILLGLVRQNIHFDKLVVEVSEDKWIVNAQGESVTSVAGLTTTDRVGDVIDFDNFDTDKLGAVTGLGFGVDLGASYKLTDDLTLSMALLNLGGIKWRNSIVAKADEEPFLFEGFKDMGNDNDIEDQVDQLGDDLEALFKFKNNGKKSISTNLCPTLNVGAEYKLPDYRELSFGLLSSTTFRPKYTYTELRGIVSVSPLRWFDASLSGVYSNYGIGWGAMLNFRPRYINFFIATDFMPINVTPQFIPLDKFNLTFNLGLSFAFCSN